MPKLSLLEKICKACRQSWRQRAKGSIRLLFRATTETKEVNPFDC